MKKIIWLVVLFFFFGIIYYNKDLVLAKTYNFIYQSPCDNPVPYRIGAVDPRFNLSTSDFTADVQEATDIWNNADGKTLFAYDPDAEMTVNLVYDGRQTLNTKIDQLN